MAVRKNPIICEADMHTYVKKFGGTSVETVDRIDQIAERLILDKQRGEQIVAVVSAMGGQTDKLIDLAKTIDRRPCPREMDVLMATGEQVTIALLAIALKKHGCSASSYTGGQVRILTDNIHNKARIMHIDTHNLLSDLRTDKIAIVAGFQGVCEDGHITTLGRGGSDTSAVALAAALNAKECQIFSDVNGIYTSDPKVVGNARKLDQISFEEMLEMASMGSKVLQTRAIEFAGKYGVPLRVCSSFNKDNGTLITYGEKTMENPKISGIAFNRNEAKLTLNGLSICPKASIQILSEIAAANIELDLILQNQTDKKKGCLSFTLHRNDYDKALDLLHQHARKYSIERITGETDLSKVSLIGIGLRSHSNVVGRILEVLGRESIEPQLISTSEIKISIIVKEMVMESVVNKLHDIFFHDPAGGDADLALQAV